MRRALVVSVKCIVGAVLRAMRFIPRHSFEKLTTLLSSDGVDTSAPHSYTVFLPGIKLSLRSARSRGHREKPGDM